MAYRMYWAFIATVSAAALLRAVMIRARVNPWVATLVASTFVLFGAGQQNIEWAFQIGFVGSVSESRKDSRSRSV